MEAEKIVNDRLKEASGSHYLFLIRQTPSQDARDNLIAEVWGARRAARHRDAPNRLVSFT
jgi:hypothetical protein